MRNLPVELSMGIALLLLVVAVAALAPVLAPANPLRTGSAPLEPPSRAHRMGTDELGRDLWSQVAHGARASLLVGVLATAASTVIGLVAGAIAGYYGGWRDESLMRVAEVFQLIPRFLVALLLVALFGSHLLVLVLIIAVTGWPMTARVLRSELLSLRTREFAIAARALGASDAGIILRHLLPNAFPAVLVGLPLKVGQAILLESGLSFLGLGDRAVASWGSLLQSAHAYLRSAWWLALFPGLALTLTVLALFLAAEGLHLMMTPALRRREIRSGAPALRRQIARGDAVPQGLAVSAGKWDV